MTENLVMLKKVAEKTIPYLISFGKTFAFAVGLIVAVILLAVVAYYLKFSEESTFLFIVLSLTTSAILYKMHESARKKQTTMRRMFSDWKNNLFSNIKSFVRFLGMALKFLFKFAFYGFLISLGIWLIIALGPLWIIVILLSLIVLAVFR